MPARIPDDVVKQECESFGFEFVGAYRANRTRYIQYICPKHRNKGVLSSRLTAFRSGTHKCKYCAGIGWTIQDLQEYLAETNPDIDVSGNTRFMHDKVHCECKACGHQWEQKGRNLKMHPICPKCCQKAKGKKIKKSQEYVEAKIREVWPNIEVIGEYTDSRDNLRCRCTVCGTEFEARSGSLIRKNKGCPTCRRKEKGKRISEAKTKYTTEIVRELFAEKRPDVTLISGYKSFHEKLTCHCEKHNNTYQQELNSLLKGHIGCAYCAAVSTSKGELKLASILENHNLSYIPQKRFEGCVYQFPLRFDYYIPSINTLVEYDGEGHYFPVDFNHQGEAWAKEQFEKTQIRDEIKNQYCADNNIPLIRIPYWHFDDMEDYLLSKISIE